MSDALIPAAAITPPVLAPAPTSQKKPKTLLKGGFCHGTGRRKTAVARVRIKAGEGKFLVNQRPMDKFFHSVRDREDVVAPLRQADALGKLDVLVRVDGGGTSGQAGAIVLGLARALVHHDPQVEIKLRDAGMLTRDSRKVERKKYGRSGARKRFQFSKR